MNSRSVLLVALIGLLPRAGASQTTERLYVEACEAGDLIACNVFGLMYETGDGVPRDLSRAASLYEMACEGGELVGCTNLGLMYADGRGVPQDDETAYMWFDLAASRFTGIDREGVVKSRDQLAAALTADQLAEAQRLAREWEAGHAPN